MGIDEIITLEDGSEYILLLSTEVDGAKYFLASKYVNEAPTDSYELFKELVIDNEFAVEQVEDKALEAKLIEDFESQVDLMDEESDDQD